MEFETFKQLVAKVAKELENYDGEITEETKRDDINFDSMAVLTLMLELGDHGYTFQDEAVVKSKTIKDLYEALQKDS